MLDIEKTMKKSTTVGGSNEETQYLQWQVQEQGCHSGNRRQKDNSGIGIGIFVTSESDQSVEEPVVSKIRGNLYG